MVNARDIYFMLKYFMQFAKKNDYLLATDTHIRNKYLKWQYDIFNLFRNKDNILKKYMLYLAF